jgi:hypothetical protein
VVANQYDDILAINIEKVKLSEEAGTALRVDQLM